MPVLLGTEVPPWVHGQTVQGKIVTFSCVDDLPEEAEQDKKFFRTSGRKSLISLPMKVGGKVAGALVFANLHSEIPWHDEIVSRLQLMADVFAGALDRQKNKLELEDRLQFEMLLAKTSARLINLPADQLHDVIRDTLRGVCERLDIDRSTLWLLSEKGTRAMHLALFYDRGDLSVSLPIDGRQLFPWVANKVLMGEVLAISKLSDLPLEASRDKESFRLYGTKSSLLIPLLTGGSVFGVLSFAVLQQEREWPELLVNRLKLVAQLFATALARQRSEQSLCESWARLSLAADSAHIALWTLDIGTGHIWTIEKARKLLGVSLNKELNLELFLSVAHPEDRERLREKMQQAVQAREDLNDEYRIIQPAGGVRWIAVRGRPYYNASGELDRLMGAAVDITERKQMEEQLCQRLQEIEKLKKRLEDENIYLQKEVKQLSEQTEIVGQSAAMKRVLLQAGQVARTNTTVLILGETGTGKELLARAIHKMSGRKDRPLLSVNCAALPPSLIESELFGRERGAFTGALTRMAGRFEVADRSTLFLDEVGDLPLELQSKLLRVIEEGTFERLGSTKVIRVDVRLIAASNRKLAKEAAGGRFRNDLFYRLNVFPIVIPPLRERPEDIPLMVWSFVTEFQAKMGKRIDNIPKKTMDALQSYEWPGNGRELRNVIERAMIMARDKTLEVFLPETAEAMSSGERGVNLQDVERRHIMSVLKRTSWRVTGKGGAAEILGMKGTTLQSKMKKLGIKRPHPHEEGGDILTIYR
ncbi:MAG TPA: Fis family transcriptional regulator [Nitrospiraceae bacterium]|nr:Fis family transcriptional regulator [Nitrospiraceae bacterium]